jgi:GTP cyclohydrolase I
MYCKKEMTNEEDTMQAIEKILSFSREAERLSKLFNTPYRGAKRQTMYRELINDLRESSPTATTENEVKDGR